MRLRYNGIDYQTTLLEIPYLVIIAYRYGSTPFQKVSKSVHEGTSAMLFRW